MGWDQMEDEKGIVKKERTDGGERACKRVSIAGTKREEARTWEGVDESEDGGEKDLVLIIGKLGSNGTRKGSQITQVDALSHDDETNF